MRKRSIAHGTGLALSMACGLLLVMLSGCQSSSQTTVKPADIQSAVGEPGQARPEITSQAKANQAKGEQIAKEMIAQHRSGQAAPEGRSSNP